MNFFIDRKDSISVVKNSGRCKWTDLDLRGRTFCGNNDEMSRVGTIENWFIGNGIEIVWVLTEERDAVSAAATSVLDVDFFRLLWFPTITYRTSITRLSLTNV